MMVSVLMITYGHENYIRQAIEGVLMQESTFDFELVVANDYSPDNTNSVVNDIISTHPKGAKIKYIKNYPNIGMQANFLEGLSKCTGKYIANCEGDDYWTDPYKLQKQVDFLEANEEYVLCFHKIKILKTNGELVEDFITKVPKDYETQETLARLGNYIHTPSVVYRNVIKEFPVEFSLSPIGDFFLYIMLSEYGKLKYLEEEMAVYRFGIGLHSTQDQIKMAKANFKLFALLLSYSNNSKINQILLKRHLNAYDNFENLIRSKYQEAFVSNNIFFKAIKSLKHPSKFWKKLKNKF